MPVYRSFIIPIPASWFITVPAFFFSTDRLDLLSAHLPPGTDVMVVR